MVVEILCDLVKEGVMRKEGVGIEYSDGVRDRFWLSLGMEGI